MARGVGAALAKEPGVATTEYSPPDYSKATVGEFKWYTSSFGYRKLKAAIEVDGNPVGTIKAEPVLNGAGQLVTWIYYLRTPIRSGMFSCPREALSAFKAGKIKPQPATSLADGYEKAKNFQPHVDRPDPSALDVKSPSAQNKSRKKKPNFDAD